MHRLIRQFVDFFIVPDMAWAGGWCWRTAPDQIPFLRSWLLWLWRSPRQLLLCSVAIFLIGRTGPMVRHGRGTLSAIVMDFGTRSQLCGNWAVDEPFWVDILTVGGR